MIKKNDYIIVMFRNGAQAEGEVVSWSSNTAELKSKDNKVNLFIMDIKQDVMAISIMHDIAPIKIMERLEQKFEEVKQSQNDPLRLKTLAQLKIAMNEQEKAIITEKLQDHTAGSLKGVKYGDQLSTLKSLK